MNRWRLRGRPLGPFRLARAYTVQGYITKEGRHQDFLTIGEVAAPDIPVLIAAKSEYAKLKWRAYLFSGYR
jgi:hypothetical protein